MGRGVGWKITVFTFGCSQTLLSSVTGRSQQNRRWRRRSVSVLMLNHNQAGFFFIQYFFFPVTTRSWSGNDRFLLYFPFFAFLFFSLTRAPSAEAARQFEPLTWAVSRHPPPPLADPQSSPPQPPTPKKLDHFLKPAKHSSKTHFHHFSACHVISS